MRFAAVTVIAVLACVTTTPALASTNKKKDKDAPAARADFHAICPFTMASPTVIAVLDARRWQSMLNAARTVPPPYEASATNFRRESIIVVALPYTSTPITQASLNPKRPERFDPKTGTLTLWYDIEQHPVKPGEAATTVVGEPCLVTWVPARSDLQQIVTRTSDGRYIAGTRLTDKTKKKAS
jgi:hypothetical protein